MSFISRTGNLASTPVLREGDHGPYCFAKVICTDRIKTKGGDWIDGPAIAYDVAVSGDEAKRLVATAERDGNVRVTFAGRYRVTEWKSDTGSRHQHEVKADSIALSFRGQDVGISEDAKSSPGAADEQQTATEDPTEPADIFEQGVSD
ncbi:single-stranded DNA-binding protein (plasmid) [Brachybacterium huguangmaarense]|uniref:Single-stranded DNA-binding protein n=1 Tax=Brachybacterium huguangmaarense TaxID=1652028 RepID=A0ABY6G524_9MICO|nr:single-stranded DNA-binding protein [Brachybacterium huguangmaarense]UYG18320.1 single-stranded DNA-binding protein [Brachybacterium huguangmaarense]